MGLRKGVTAGRGVSKLLQARGHEFPGPTPSIGKFTFLLGLLGDHTSHIPTSQKQWLGDNIWAHLHPLLLDHLLVRTKPLPSSCSAEFAQLTVPCSWCLVALHTLFCLPKCPSLSLSDKLLFTLQNSA